MKCFTIRKTKSKLHILTFSKSYFARLKKIHPYATTLIVYSVIKFNKDVAGKTLVLNHEQEEELTAILQKYEKHKGETTYAQHCLETMFVSGFSLTRIDIERAPEVLDEIYKIIRGE